MEDKLAIVNYIMLYVLAVANDILHVQVNVTIQDGLRHCHAVAKWLSTKPAAASWTRVSLMIRYAGKGSRTATREDKTLGQLLLHWKRRKMFEFP